MAAAFPGAVRAIVGDVLSVGGTINADNQLAFDGVAELVDYIS